LQFFSGLGCAQKASGTGLVGAVMTERNLDVPDVQPDLQQMDGDGMPQRMRRSRSQSMLQVVALSVMALTSILILSEWSAQAEQSGWASNIRTEVQPRTVDDVVYLILKIIRDGDISDERLYNSNDMASIFGGIVAYSGVAPDGTVWGQLKFRSSNLDRAIVLYNSKKTARNISLYAIETQSIEFRTIEQIIGKNWTEMSGDTVGGQLGVQSKTTTLRSIKYTIGKSTVVVSFFSSGKLASLRAADSGENK
jgi:hypothetical protein